MAKSRVIWLLMTALIVHCVSMARAEDGYDLWLRYRPLAKTLQSSYRPQTVAIALEGRSPVLETARNELSQALTGLLGRTPHSTRSVAAHGTILLGTSAASPDIAALKIVPAGLDPEGYVIASVRCNGHATIVVAANSDVGVLHGTFHLIRLIQTGQPLNHLAIVSAPAVRIRMLDHWDNLNRTLERGYSGFSIWNWPKLPDYLDPRYADYARALASVGINGVAVNNVDAQAAMLNPAFIAKAAALADLFRHYGIKIYFAARFTAPMEIGGQATADPLAPGVAAWWRAKADEIYRAIPDFGGFVVKANSEGQPGPQDYGRSHADGANMLARVLAPHHGVVLWRAFVYSQDSPEDRIKKAYSEFAPLDGHFDANVIIQSKNGPLDFQPREPFSPLFGGLRRTNVALELQITKEYLGFSTHLVYLGPLWKEVLDSDTYARGAGSTVARIVDGSVFVRSLTAIVGDSNVGTDRNWCGSEFDQANLFAFGRLAWDPGLSARSIAEEWLRMTFSNAPKFVDPITAMMMGSRETAVNYMTPLGLAHLMGSRHHYGPAPWVDDAGRPEWNPVYYHRADAGGIGFDRTATGSNAVAQYAPEVRDRFSDLNSVPDSLLLWFHHVSWDHRLKSGRTVWEELTHRYTDGADGVAHMHATWAKMRPYVDAQRFNETATFLSIQEKEAIWWRDACIAYFQSVSGKALPADIPPPAHPLSYYKALRFPYQPGVVPRPNEVGSSL